MTLDSGIFMEYLCWKMALLEEIMRELGSSESKAEVIFIVLKNNISHFHQETETIRCVCSVHYSKMFCWIYISLLELHYVHTSTLT